LNRLKLTLYTFLLEHMKTYVFRVVGEPDKDKWAVHCPALLKYAATSWGNTREEALKNIQEVIEMTMHELIEDNEPIPEEPAEEVMIFPGPWMAITL
jgi:predicted RNase H-like HicB family nuclease